MDMPELTTTAAEANEELRRKVAFLREPGSYSPAPARVEAVETHMSWVFLTDSEAFKLKKPVRLDGLDFTTLENRRHACAEEVRLNRRLAPEVYLGVVALAPTPDGSFALRDETALNAADYLVWMRRLPSARLLDQAIARAEVQRDAVLRVADVLAAFYARSAAPEVTAADLSARLRRSIDAAEAELLDHPRAVDGGRARAAAAGLRSHLAAHEPSLRARVAAGRIVEGHGDLRPEHVFLGPPTCIIDCLEFERRLRLQDWSEEVAFLGVECERLGAEWVGGLILARCGERLQDAPPPALVSFYRSIHAFIRARIAIRHLRDEVVRTPEKWPSLTRTYLDLTERHLAAA